MITPTYHDYVCKCGEYNRVAIFPSDKPDEVIGFLQCRKCGSSPEKFNTFRDPFDTPRFAKWNPYNE